MLATALMSEAKRLDGTTRREEVLLRALGIDPGSFDRVIEWALCEHLVSVLVHDPQMSADLFTTPDGMHRFRNLLEERTKRRWSPEDVESLFQRLKLERQPHYRDPIPLEDYLRLLWQSPLACARCGRMPPDVVLHVDHVVPASRGGSSNRTNLQFLCAEDNLRKSNKREVSDRWLDLQ